MKTIKMFIVVAFVLLFATSWTGASWGEEGAQGEVLTVETYQSALEKLKAKRMKVAVDLQLLQLEGQMLVDEMNKIQEEARKLRPKIDKLRKEFKDLTDKIRGAENQ